MFQFWKSDVPIFVVLLINLMIQFFKSDCPILTHLSYVSPNFNCYDPSITCITYYMFTHIKLLHLSNE
jgi:hypothetical protein